MRRRIESVRRRLDKLPRFFAAALALLVLASIALTFVLTTAVVTVVDADGTRHTVLTNNRHPRQIVEMAGLTAGEEDQLIFTATSSNTASVIIQRAFPAAVMVDGEVRTAEFTSGTVADLIEACDVTVGPQDILLPQADTPLEEGLTVRVQRVSYSEELRQEEVPQETLAAYTATLAAEEEFVESYNGVYDVTYRHRLVDGEIADSEIVSMVAIPKPWMSRPVDSYEIQQGVPCSRIDSFDDIEMGPDGRPLNYTRLMPSARSTNYSSSGGRGASGLGLYCGTVAVNPNVIPYGTRLFIISPDNNWVYGFAIATDTGIALMDGRIDVDLYFETNAECYQFHTGRMDIYILD